MADLNDLLATTDRAALRELIIAAYAAWETHYSGGYLYTDDPAAVALFDEAREQYRAWRVAREQTAITAMSRTRAIQSFWTRIRGVVPDVSYPELVLLEAEHGQDVDDATARKWLEQHRARAALAADLPAWLRSSP